MLRFARMFAKGLGWLLVGLLGLGLLVAFAIQLPPVRGLIRDQVLAAVRGSIKGEIQLDDVRWPSPEHLEISGLTVKDRQGKPALSLATLVVNLHLPSLIAGQIEVHSVEASNLFVDLAELDDKSGLLSLFASDEPPKEPQPKSPNTNMSPIAVTIREVCIEHGEARLRPASDQAFKLTQLDGCVRLRIAEGLYIATNVLQARISRNDQVLAVLRPGAELPQLAEELPANTLLTSLDAKFEMRAGEMSFDTWFKARGFSPATLRALGIETDALQRNLNLDVHARQKDSVLAYRAQLHSAAGQIDANGALDAQKMLNLHVLSPALRPAAVSSVQLPKLGFAIDAQASLADPKQTELRVNVTRGFFDNFPLPLLTLQAVQKQDGTTVVESLRASYGAAAVSGSGELASSGALRAQIKLAVPELAEVPPLKAAGAGLRGDVTAQVNLKRDAKDVWDTSMYLASNVLGAQAAQARQVKLDAHVSGILARPVLTLDLRVAEAAGGGQVFTNVAIGLDGGPQRYQFRASADEKKLRADGWLAPDLNAWNAGLKLQAEFPQGPLRVSVPKLRLVPSESLDLTDLVAEFVNAKLRAAGRVAFQGSDSKLRLSAEVPDMTKLLRALGQTEQPGRLTFKGLLQGELQRPTADVELRYVDGPKISGDPSRLALDLHAKAARGTSSLTINAGAGDARIDAQLDSKWARNLPLSAAVQAAHHDLKLSVRDASLAELMDPQSPLPSRLVDGRVQADVIAQGNLDKLQLQAELRSGLHMGRDRRSIDTVIKADYHNEQLKLDVDAGDRRGQLLKVRAAASVPVKRQIKAPTPARELIDALNWELETELSQRPLSELPYLAGQEIDPELGAVRVAMHAQLGHAPRSEPSGTFEAQLAWDAHRVKLERNSSCQDSTGGRALLAAKWAEQKLGVELSGGAKNDRTLQVSARAHVPFSELLDGGLKDFAGIQLAAKLRELNLQEVPWACRHGRGQVSLDSEARDLLTPGAKVSAHITTKAVRWDDSPDLNLSLDANTIDKALRVTGEMQAGSGRTQIAGSLPIDVHASKPEEMLRRKDPVEIDLQLQRMPMATLLAPVSAVKRVSGTTTGQLRLRGSMEKPAVNGELALDDVSLTIPRAGQRFSHLHLKASLDGSTLRLSEGRVKDLDGSASVAALVQLENVDVWKAELNLNARNFPLRNSGVIMGRADLNAKAKADLTRERTKVLVELTDVAIDLNADTAAGVQSLDPHPEFSFVDQGPADLKAKLQEQQDKPDPKAEQNDRLPAEIRVVSRDGVWVRRDDFAVEMQTDITATIAARQTPRLQGEIKLLRGYINLFGQNFDIKTGRVVLAGGETIDPQLDITAQHDTPGGSSVVVKVTGFARAPQLEFQVDGKAATARDALVAITGGGRGNAGKGSAEDQIANAAIGMTTGLLTLGARREFGDWVPMLAIEQSGVRVGVEADKFIPKVLRGFVRGAYVEGIVSTQNSSSAQGGQAGPGAQSTGGGNAMASSGTGVLLELMLPKHFVWAGQYGPGQAWSIDLDWRP